VGWQQEGAATRREQQGSRASAGQSAAGTRRQTPSKIKDRLPLPPHTPMHHQAPSTNARFCEKGCWAERLLGREGCKLAHYTIMCYSPMRTPVTSPQSANRPLICSSVALQGRLPTKMVELWGSSPAAAAVPLTSRRCFFLAAGCGAGAKGAGGRGQGAGGRSRSRGQGRMSYERAVEMGAGRKQHEPEGMKL
jgi:hypothetical protein